MKLKRYEAAIETLKLCQEYQALWGTSNMIGKCYLYLGNHEEADKWYGELLWSDAHYMKALIKYALKDKECALKHLLIGILWNPHIAEMLIAIDKPDKRKACQDLHD